MPAPNTFNRRRFDRFELRAGCTSVEVVPAGDEATALDGHAYDISEGGIRMEIDGTLATQTPVSLAVGLPGEPEAVRVSGSIAWIDDDTEDPGPQRIAIAFSVFETDADRRRLCAFLGGSMRQAA